MTINDNLMTINDCQLPPNPSIINKKLKKQQIHVIIDIKPAFPPSLTHCLDFLNQSYDALYPAGTLQLLAEIYGSCRLFINPCRYLIIAAGHYHEVINSGSDFKLSTGLFGWPHEFFIYLRSDKWGCYNSGSQNLGM